MIEFTAIGVSLGASMEIEARIPSDVHLGSKIMIEILVSTSVDTPPGLEVLFLRDIEAGSPPEYTGDIEDGRHRYIMSIVPRGRTGQGTLRIIVKGEMFKATLAIQELEFDVSSPFIKAELMDRPVELRKGDGLPLRFVSPDADEHEVEIKAEFLTADGSRIGEASAGPVTIQGSREIFLSPEGLKGEGKVDLRIRIKEGTEKMVQTFAEAVVLEADSSCSYILMGDPSPGGTGTIQVEGEPGTDSLIIFLCGDEQEWRVESSIEASVISFRYPDDIKGRLKARILTDSGEFDLGEYDVELKKPASIESARFTPDRISSGSDVTLVLRYEADHATDERLSGRIGSGGLFDVGFDLDPADTIKEVRVEIPKDISSRSLSPVLTLLCGDMECDRKVLSGALEIKDESMMNILLAVPGTISVSQENEPFAKYLFPGETIRNRSSMGGLTRFITTTGRSIHSLDGSIIFGLDWSGNEGKARSLMVQMELQDMIEGSDILEDLRSSIDDLGKMYQVSISGNEEDKDLDWWKQRINKPGSKDKGPISGPYLSHWSIDKQKLDPIANVAGSKDLVPSLFSHLNDILDGDKGTVELKKMIEGIIKDLRSSKLRSSSTSIRSAKLVCMKELRRTVRSLTKGSIRRETLRDLFFNLIISYLLRIESLVSWDHDMVTAWDLLRVERTRSLKSEINSLLDLLEKLNDLHRRVSSRLTSYRNNMEVRRSMASLIGASISNGSTMPEGIPGTGWRSRLIIENLSISEKTLPRVYMKLPGPGWNILGSISSRDGDVFEVQPDHTDSGLELELIINSPVTAGNASEAFVYLSPSRSDLEVEP